MDKLDADETQQQVEAASALARQNREVVIPEVDSYTYGVMATNAGTNVQKVPANRLPAKFGFMVAHPSATVAPTKLEDFNVHNDTIYSSGAVVTGRICYDAFVLDNKKKGIYYQATT